jgi:8-oxo-dGTP pyrophosphatase MutT (NUDIX family)
MDITLKNAYLSPATGNLDISIIRDARPYALITLDLGIPNFTVFSLKFPLVEDKPNSMSGLVAEAVHTLLDEMSAFMLSCNYPQETIVQIYAATLACFKGMTGESDTNKSMSPISKDPTVKVFEGSFKLPVGFVNETYDKVVTAGKSIKRPPVVRHLELTYDKPEKTTVNDARKVIRNYRNRSLKSQPNPMYVIVYDQMGNPRGTIPLGSNFKNQLLNTIYKKKAAKTPEFSPTVKFDNDTEMKTTNAKGIPKSIFVGDEQYAPYGFIGDDMAIYLNEKKEWVVKFPDGRCVAFSDIPSLDELKEGNYPVPTLYTDWTLLSKEDIPESSDMAEAVDEQGNEVIEPSETNVNPQTDLKPDDEKNEQLEEGVDEVPEKQEKTSAVSIPAVQNKKEKNTPYREFTPQPGWHYGEDIGVYDLKVGDGITINDEDGEIITVTPDGKVTIKYDKSGDTIEYKSSDLRNKRCVVGRNKTIHELKVAKNADHYDENGYWAGSGGGASGILPICITTGRICLAWRSPYVNEGDCWGTIGGAIQPEMSPADSAKKEMQEEVGYQGSIRLIPAYVFSYGSFKYFNFIGLVPTEFGLNPMQGSTNNLDFEDETDSIKWFTWNELQQELYENPGSFHSGLIKLLEQSKNQIQKICQSVSNKEHEE